MCLGLSVGVFGRMRFWLGEIWRAQADAEKKAQEMRNKKQMRKAKADAEK